MAHRKPWARPRCRLSSAPVLALAAAFAAVLPAVACTSAPASTAVGGQRNASPAITATQARQVFDRYAAAAKTTSPDAASPVLSLVTGVERAVVTATLKRHSVTRSGSPPSAQGAYRSSLSVKPVQGVYAYGSPTFYLPEAAGYPRFFVASVSRSLLATKPANSTSTGVGGARVAVDGPVLMLFSQAAAGAPWLLASSSRLPAGVTLPRLAADSAGYVSVVRPSAATLLARPDYVGPLQAAVVDDGPASAASKAVADGPLTTGMYQGARDHVDGMTAPRGDVYQWELQGTSYPQFALRTAAGGALVFYAMALNSTVAVPDMIDKASPVRSGPPIQVPVDLRMLLPASQSEPLIQLSSSQLLSFAAVDPPQGNAKIQVIAIGGGLVSASAS